MERPSEIRAELMRSPEKYNMTDLCHYANELLRKHNENTSAADTAPYLSWYHAGNEIKLVARCFDQQLPKYQLHFKDEQTIGQHLTYVFSESVNATTLYNVGHEQINASTPFENNIELMAHLRSNPYLAEPQNNRATTTAFRRTMAHLAIDTARYNGHINIPELATIYDSLYFASNFFHAQEDALESSVTHDDTTYLFTRSERDVDYALRDQIWAYRNSIPALPAPAKSDTPPSN